MAPIEQHRRPTIGGRKLEPAGRGHIRRFHLGDDAGERFIAQGILGHGQHLNVLAALRVEQLVRTQSDLLEARSVEIESGHGPQHVEAGLIGETRGNASKKESSSCVVAQTG